MFLRRIASVVLVVLTLGTLLAGPAYADGPNLLQNPGFERPYVEMAVKENCRIAASWVPYYYEGIRQETTQGYRLAPEYKAAFWYDYPFNRVRSGELSQQYFHSFGNFEGGIYQQVSNVSVGDLLRFQIWAMTWSCDKESSGHCAGATSGDPSPMRLRVGIDPTGGTNAKSANVVWSEEENAYDAWMQIGVEAEAAASTVTVFVYAYPEYRSQDNNVYLDDASLTVETSRIYPVSAPAPLAPEEPVTPTVDTDWPISGALTGNVAGGFSRYHVSFASTDRVTLAIDVAPYDRVIGNATGFEVYCPDGEVLRSQSSGTLGRAQASFTPVVGADYLIQVYNYLDGRTVSYTLSR
ncbi:MAG: hypothetical protein ACYC4R_09500 [Anaerolineae bacterium]